ARVQKDIRNGSSNIGGIFTGVVREKDFDAYTASGDYSLRWDSNKYTWNGQWSGTRAPISGVVQNGFGGVTNFNYNSNLGFFGSRNNKQQISGGINLTQPDPTKHFRNLNYNASYFQQYTNDGLL